MRQPFKTLIHQQLLSVPTWYFRYAASSCGGFSCVSAAVVKLTLASRAPTMHTHKSAITIKCRLASSLSTETSAKYSHSFNAGWKEKGHRILKQPRVLLTLSSKCSSENPQLGGSCSRRTVSYPSIPTSIKT